MIAATACTGGVGQAIRPDDPTYTAAVSPGGRCLTPSNREAPLVVDWDVQSRGDLEVAMKRGIAVVAYDCKTLRVLPDCRVDGDYSFLGVTVKEQLLRLENADEVRANLPFSGAVLGAQLGASMARGSTLDVALVVIGKRVASRGAVSGTQLAGQCAGATHFVRAATVGAFVVKTGTRGQASAAAEVLKVGASASSSSDKRVQNRDGDPDVCRKASPDAAAPAPGCGALVRLQLAGVRRKATPAPGTALQAAPGCPQGMVLSEGKCTSRATARAFQCNALDLVTCTKQCRRGHPGSCSNLAAMLVQGTKVARDLLRAVGLLQRACEAGHNLSCANLGVLYAGGQGVNRDLPRAIALLNQACYGGVPDACANLGALYLGHAGLPVDHQRAASLFARGCRGGGGFSCFKLGRCYTTGDGVGEKDSSRALDYFGKSCTAGEPRGCHAASLEAAKYPNLRSETLFLLWTACRMGHAKSCALLGFKYLRGEGAPRSLPHAVKFIQQACDLGYGDSCGVLGMFYALGKHVTRDMLRAHALMDRACELGQAIYCKGAKYRPHRGGAPAAKDRAPAAAPTPAPTPALSSKSTPAAPPAPAVTSPAPAPAPTPTLAPTPAPIAAAASVEGSAAPEEAVSPAPLEQAQAELGPQRNTWWLYGSIGLAAVGAALAGWGAATSSLAEDAAQEHDQARFDGLKTQQSVLFGVAGALGVASVTGLLVYLFHRQEQPAGVPAAGIGVTSNGVGISGSWTF